MWVVAGDGSPSWTTMGGAQVQQVSAQQRRRNGQPEERPDDNKVCVYAYGYGCIDVECGHALHLHLLPH